MGGVGQGGHCELVDVTSIWGRVDWCGLTWWDSGMTDDKEFTLLMSWFCWFHLVSIQKRKFHRCTLYARPLIVFTPPPHAPCCSHLTCFAGILWWAMSFTLKTTACDSIILTGKSWATCQTYVMGMDWARVTNLQPVPTPAGTCGTNLHGFTNPWHSLSERWSVVWLWLFYILEFAPIPTVYSYRCLSFQRNHSTSPLMKDLDIFLDIQARNWTKGGLYSPHVFHMESIWNPSGIHLIPEGFHSFQMEYILAGIPLFLVIPFHLYSTWNGQIPSGMSIWIPSPFHWIPNRFHNSTGL